VFNLAAEYNTRILIHPETDAPHILPLADKYSDATVIMAHLSGRNSDHIEAIRRSKHGNIYTDVATMRVISNNVIENAVRQIGSERILFGTDTYSAGFIRGRIEYSPISEDDKINILRNNALRLFKDKL
jgi:predicted TIM-barrel fold metal-dependent hydrolase